MSKKLFGWKKDKFDSRDYLHEMSLIQLPTSIDLSAFMPNVRMQGDVGACVGFGVAANLGCLARKNNFYTEWFSPTWIYNGARYIEGDLREDNGCYARDALSWLKNKGALLEHYWPYNPNYLDMSSPPSADNIYAKKYPLLAYYRVTNDVAGICSALSKGFPVSIGTPWFNKWMNPKKDGVLAVVTTKDIVAGGHETCLYGYDSIKGVFYGQNSWDVTWGNKGRYIIPFSAFSVFKKIGGYDAYYVTFTRSLK